MAICPFHSEHTPSCKLYEKNYYCFGCQAHGDIIRLVQVYEIEGRKYIVISHFTGQKDLDEVVYRNAYNQTMSEVLHA